jgi:DNA-directed RNA polymerase specialized sigma24 family protein
MSAAPLPLPEAFRTVGGAIDRRVRRLTGDGALAQRTAEELFVRFVVHGRAAGDARVRWNWIYRVATARALQLLEAEARPGGASPGHPAAGPLPDMRALRALDEASQNALVLARLDGLPAEEIAEVLGIDLALVRRKLSEADARLVTAPASPQHPSLLALERDREAAATHVATCAACQATVAELDDQARAFAAAVTPEVLNRVASALRAERERQAPRTNWRRIFFMSSAFVIVSVMAFVVARPRAVKPEQLPFRGPITAARLKAAGLQITVRRGDQILALAPGAPSRIGDRFHFRVRAEGPRYLEVLIHGPGGEARLYPATGTTAAPVTPGQTLDRDYLVEAPLAAPGKALWIMGRFSEHPFPLDTPSVPDVETVPVRVDLEP